MRVTQTVFNTRRQDVTGYLQGTKTMSTIEDLNAIYTKGLSDEEHIMGVLRKLGYGVYESTEQEDMMEDIDCFVSGLNEEDTYAWAVSIKCDGVKSHNLAFELEGYSKRHQKWFPSWYYTGMSQYYVVWKKVVNTIYVINTPLLNRFVDEHGFGYLTGISKKTREIQSHHNQSDTHIGLISISTLISKGIASVLLENVLTDIT